MQVEWIHKCVSCNVYIDTAFRLYNLFLHMIIALDSPCTLEILIYFYWKQRDTPLAALSVGRSVGRNKMHVWWRRAYAHSYTRAQRRHVYTVMCTGLSANCFQMFEIEFVMQSTASGIGITAYRFYLCIYLFDVPFLS